MIKSMSLVALANFTSDILLGKLSCLNPRWERHMIKSQFSSFFKVFTIPWVISTGFKYLVSLYRFFVTIPSNSIPKPNIPILIPPL